MSPAPIGLNTYSIRAFRWPDLKLIDYAASLKLDGVFLQDSVDPETNEPPHWPQVKAAAQPGGFR